MNKRLPLLLSLLGVILLAASLAYWILQLYRPPQRPLAAVAPTTAPEPSIDAAATLFGGRPAVASATNYTVTGIVSAGRDSVAILVADNAPPKALKVGKELAPGVTLAEVYPRYVMLSDGGVLKRVDLPADARGPAQMGGAAAAAGRPAGGAVGAQPTTPAGTPAPGAAPGASNLPEPPMSPGAVPQQPPQQVPEYNPPPPEPEPRDTPQPPSGSGTGSQPSTQMPAPTQPSDNSSQ